MRRGFGGNTVDALPNPVTTAVVDVVVDVRAVEQVPGHGGADDDARRERTDRHALALASLRLPIPELGEPDHRHRGDELELPQLEVAARAEIGGERLVGERLDRRRKGIGGLAFDQRAQHASRAVLADEVLISALTYLDFAAAGEHSTTSQRD